MRANTVNHLFYLFFMFLNRTYAVDQMAHTKFAEQTICHAQNMIDTGCFTQQNSARSRLACFVICSLNPVCLGVLVSIPSQTCYIGQVCDLDPSCSPIDSDFRYYERIGAETSTEAPTVQSTEPPPCEHNGVHDLVTDSCDCSGTEGYVGVRCERAATSCVDLYDYNYDPGMHALNIDLFGDGTVFYRTTCHLKKWYATQVSFDIMRSTGSFDASLSYDDYVTGFRFGPEDYWIGLENLHKYTDDGRNHKVRLTVNFNSSDAVGELAISHHNFVVAPASLGYFYTLDSYLSRGLALSVRGSTAGFWLNDVLLFHANNRFSTADNDQDQANTRNCAQLAHAGWWFGDCHPFLANPFGWSYSAKPGSVTNEHFSMSGLEMSRSNVQSAVQYVYITLDYA